ncbi:phosphoadenosine phosphosulfate reductase family protein [Perilla frutescens var. hirtella]|uniref:Phosphoadenosine phosphosulfate reductase family protein n=1 Tax=Perilla frutescens var. hirtella TaxID=608512 RepID=A0AAD4JGL0_PERFH|nr:phosphoadenosine phosphosulfate reductase family protein [Perilla frutescens var. hirtella]
MSGDEVKKEDAVNGKSEKQLEVLMWGYFPGVMAQRSPLNSPANVRFLETEAAGDSLKDVCTGGCGFGMALFVTRSLLEVCRQNTLILKNSSLNPSVAQLYQPPMFPLGLSLDNARASVGDTRAFYAKPDSAAVNSMSNLYPCLDQLQTHAIRGPVYQSPTVFPEINSFTYETASIYKLLMDIIRLDFKSGLEALMQDKPIRAIFLGVRIGDPTALGQEQFSPSSPGWPPFMRVDPILDWSYRLNYC